jgi:hypothetical protein
MGTRLGRFLSARLRVAVGVVVLAALTVATAAAPAGAASRAADLQVAQAGVFVLGDLPAGFQSAASTSHSHADNLRAAKGVSGCAPYVALQKVVMTTPQASSADFDDSSRRVSNEVDVFRSDRAAGDVLALYAKSSIVGCLKKLFEKQLLQDPSLEGKIRDATVTVERQDIAGLGDDSVVYEGKVVLTGTDGSTAQLGVGNAAVQVGRAVSVVSYSTEGGDLTEILTPAIDASVARLRAALA